MNPAAIAMMPTNTINVTKQSSTVGSSSTGKFGEALNNAMVNKSEVTKISSTEAELTTEETIAIEELLAFLGVESLSDLQDGNAMVEQLFIGENLSENDALLQLLKHVSGEDESRIEEVLTSLANLNISVLEENETNQTDVPRIGGVSELTIKETSEEMDIPSEIYALLQKIESLDIKDWSKLDILSVGNLLKLAKLQDLLASEQDLSKDAALMQKEMKNLLDSISGKLEKWMSSQPKLGNESAFSTVLLENGANKPLEVVKQVYSRVFNSEDGVSGDKISNGLTLKTSETNTQNSGLPFQMSKLEQYVLTTSKNGQAVDAEQFIKSFENILSKANFSNTNGVQKLLIRLNPENLGSLRIELVQKDGAMIAKILATTAQAKELLDRQVQGLKHAFMNQNISVEKIEITQQISTFNAERFAPRDQGQQEQRQQQTEKEIIEDEETDFTDRFEELLLNLKV